MPSSWGSRTVMRFSLLAKALATPTAFGVAGLVHNNDDQILLVRHRFGRQWQLPGGGVFCGEPPARAVLRELAEEVGLRGGSACLFGLYTRKVGWTSNVVALYRILEGEVRFVPNVEIEAICFTDPHDPPEATSPATRRRFAELTGKVAPTCYW